MAEWLITVGYGVEEDECAVRDGDLAASTGSRGSTATAAAATTSTNTPPTPAELDLRALSSAGDQVAAAIFRWRVFNLEKVHSAPS